MVLQNNIPKKYLHAALVLFLLITIPLIMYTSNNQQSTPVKAAVGNAVLRLEPAAISIQKDSTGTFAAYVLPNTHSVSAVELVITYDPAVIQITAVNAGNFFTKYTSQVGAPVEIIKNFATPGKIHYAIGFPLGSNFFSATADTVATISYKALAAGVNKPITLVTTGTPATMVADKDANNVLGSVNNATITVTTQTVPTATGIISPTVPATPTTIPSTISPTQPAQCPKKSLGDADCKKDSNQKDIGLPDFEIWRKEYFAGCNEQELTKCGNDDDLQGTLMDADFNNLPETSYNGAKGVSLLDFETWRRNYFLP